MRGIIRVTRSHTSPRDRLATGCSVTTYGNPGKPYERAIASAEHARRYYRLARGTPAADALIVLLEALTAALLSRPPWRRGAPGRR